MSWYSIRGAASMVKDKAQLEPWDVGRNDGPWWHWDLSGSIGSKES